MTEYILAEDATSPTRKTIYAKKGNTVKLVSDHGRALIVENEKGNRFPINSKNIISLKHELEPAIHQRIDHLAQEQGKKLRRKKADNIHSGSGGVSALYLFE